MEPVKLAYIPFHPVARHRFPYLSRYGDAKLSALTFPPDHVTSEIGSPAPPPLFIYAEEILLPPEALISGQLTLARHNRLITSKPVST